jgi:oligopeptidase A
VSHLNSVADTPELRAAYNEAYAGVTEFWTRGRRRAPLRQVQSHRRLHPDAEQRQAHKTRCATLCCRGADLQGEAKERFAVIQERQAELSQKFSENALDATDAFELLRHACELSWRCPDDVVQAPAPPPRPMAKKATSSRSKCRATCL